MGGGLRVQSDECKAGSRGGMRHSGKRSPGRRRACMECAPSSDELPVVGNGCTMSRGCTIGSLATEKVGKPPRGFLTGQCLWRHCRWYSPAGAYWDIVAPASQRLGGSLARQMHAANL